MKRIVCFVSFIACLLGSACKENPDWAAGTLNPTVSIMDVRALYKGSDLVLTQDKLSGGVQIAGVVNADYQNGNMPDGIITIQSTLRTKTRGIALRVGDDVASTLKLGDSVLFQIKDKRLVRGNGCLMIDGVGESDVKVLSSDHRLTPQTITASALLALPDEYESVLVKIANCSPADPSSPDLSYEGGLFVEDETGSLTIYAQPDTPVSELSVPEKPATYIGIAFADYEQSEAAAISLWPRFASDIIEKYILLAWNLTGYNISTGLTRDATVVDPNLEVSTLSRGPGLEAQQASNAFSSVWPIDIDRVAAMEHGSYYEFSIVPKNNAKVSLLSLDIALRVQPEAPKNYMWMYSDDQGEHFVPMSGELQFEGKTTDNNGIQQPTLSLEEVEGIQSFSSPVIIRVYAWGATNATSAFRIGQSRPERPYALTIEGMTRCE